MKDSKDTIGLQELLDEVSKDLDELVQKNPKDYGNRGTLQWWLLERERLLGRHVPATVVKKLLRASGLRKWLVAFGLGFLATLIADAGMRLLIP